jgi:hypothetical protein
MPDLRYLNTDGEYLLLEGADGTRFRLLIDEGIRKAVRRDQVSEADTNLLTPREIQLEVRAGVSVEDLAAKTGASIEYISKFATPVLAELIHVVNSALSVRITLAGDRYRDSTQIEFGEVVANRLASNGVVEYNWTAKKSDNGGWQLSCRFGDTVATWAFDSRKLALSPENEVAVQLSAQQTLTDSPLPKLRTVTPSLLPEPESSPIESNAPTSPASPLAAVPAPAQEESPIEDDFFAELEAEDIDESPVLKSVPTVTADLGRTAEFDGVVPFGRVSGIAAPESEPAESLANTADLLDALRQRRIAREHELTKTASMPIIQDTDEGDIDEAGGQNSQHESNDEELEFTLESDESIPKAAPKRGRSSMPSWDEIVFSTKPEEDD